mgnify:CR=1 FL=1
MDHAFEVNGHGYSNGQILVSILVLMDHAFEVLFEIFKFSDVNIVSILVLMDHAFEVLVGTLVKREILVSILVLMDHAFEG